jgi:ribosomal protein S18 acetylase RimI-like enzyme
MSSDETPATIIQAKEAHVGLIVPLFLAYSEFYGRTVPAKLAREFLREGLASGESVILLALQDRPISVEDAALGFLQMHPSRSSKRLGRRWIINDLYVVETARRQHLGRRLFVAAQEYAAQTGAKDLRLSTKITNTGARAFYESLGWQALDEFINYELPLE